MKNKRTIFFTISKKDDPFELFNKDCKNSLLFFKNNKYYYNSKFGKKYEVNFRFDYLEYDKQTCKSLINLYEAALKIAREFSAEPIYEIFNTKVNFKTIIYSSINNLDYKNEYEKISIFELFAKIFIKLLMNHIFANGNKRFALAYLILILRVNGFYFKWTFGEFKNYKLYEDAIEQFVVYLSKTENNSPEIYGEIKKWIIKNSIINLPK